MAGCRKRAPVTIGYGVDAFTSALQPTGNPQVARYTLRPHSPAQVTVEFGPAYGLKTWTVSASPSDPARILVAGMRADTTYHMRAEVRFRDGTEIDDADHAFRTGHYKLSMLPPITVQFHGQPQPGVELLNLAGADYQAMVTDLQGHVLWAYDYPDRESIREIQIHRDIHAVWLTLRGWKNEVRGWFGLPPQGRSFWWDASMFRTPPKRLQTSTMINPIKQLPNGNFLIVIAPASFDLINSPDGKPAPDTTVVLREVNLAGQVVRNLTMRRLDRELRASGYRGPQLELLHHDFALLPNGHIILLANATKEFSNLPGYPGTTRVVGDVLVDLDRNWKPVWTWNEFDHLDVRHHPLGLPDWTHTNAVVYTKDDGNLIVSMRAQHWVIKIDYDNGKGSGKILWRLGPGGDLRLIGGQAPTDWNYGQHDPVIFGNRDAGVFDLGMMDNGFGRIMPDGKVCGTKGAPACYSAAVIYRIDAKAKTAAIVFRKVFPPSQYSFWGGSVQPLANGDIEIDMCSVGKDSDIYEMTRTADPKTVWQMHVANTNVYRSERLGSLYPGVQW